MAGFFGLFNYARPGKGVDPDAPQQRAFFRFFTVLWRNLGKLVGMNFLFFVVVSPLLTCVYLWLAEVVRLFLETDAADDVMAIFRLKDFLFVVPARVPILGAVLLVLSAAVFGAANCGLAYCLRNFWREEHVFWSDLWTKARENFKNGLVLGLIDLAVFFFAGYNLAVTSATFVENAGANTQVFNISRVVSLVVLVVWSFARNYLYVMTVTLHLRVRDVLKNAVLFAVLGFFRNFLAVGVALVLLLPMLVVQWMDVWLFVLLYFSVSGLVGTFACYPLVHRHLVLPALQK